MPLQKGKGRDSREKKRNAYVDEMWLGTRSQILITHVVNTARITITKNKAHDFLR